MKYLRIRNWDRWQSYRKDRGQPPWIKVHRCLMRNLEWVELTDAERGQLVAIWLLAADHNGVIPASPAVVGKLCFMSDEPDLRKFIGLGFIEPEGRQGDANLTPTRRQGDQPKAEAEAEAKADTTAGSPASNTARPSKRKATEYPPEFETAWAAYPKRAGDNPKRRAFRAWSARAKEGHTADEMLAGVNRYAEFCRATGKVGTETVKQAATFFGPDLAFLEDWAAPAEPRAGNGGHPRSDDEWVAAGERLGIFPRRGETMHDLKVRVRAALDGTRQGVSA
ncbi:hypothetical protein [Thioalkalivibrio sulfidiphilus]|uniref:hypothetical protein n=1 Tax=Thioalkalivibrio sulfidiphilus TaxID=1033854 RepID=UPI003B35CF47